MLLRLLLTGSLKTWQAECSQQHGLEHKNLVQNLKSSPLSKCVHSTAYRAVPQDADSLQKHCVSNQAA